MYCVVYNYIIYNAIVVIIAKSSGLLKVPTK